MRMQLGLATCSLLLKSAVAAQAEGHVIALSTIWLLLDKQREFARQLSPCGHSIEGVKQAPKISLAQLEGTPNVQADSHDWRARLAAEFQTEAKLHHEITVRTVDQICRDLEERCKNAEAPFREEQRKRKELQDQCDEISKHAADLEAQAVDQRLYLEALEKEKVQIQADLSAVQSDNDDLSEEATELRRHLKEAHQQAERQLATSSAQHKKKELELRTTIAAKESSLEEQERIIRELAKDKEATQDELQAVRQELDEFRGSHDLVSKKLSEVEHGLSVEQDRLVDMEAQLRMLNTEKAEISALKEQMQGELDSVNAQLSTLSEKYEGLVVSTREEMETLAYQHQEALQSLNEQAPNGSQATNAKAEHEEELRRAHEENAQLRHAHDSLSLELQEKEAEVAKLMRKVDKLTKAFIEKEAELTEAQSIRKNMLNALGIREEVAAALAQAPATKMDHGQPPRTRAPQRKSHPGAISQARHAFDEDPLDTAEPAMDANRSFESVSSKSGPTPKRAKPRKSFKVPTLQQPRLSVFPQSTKSVRSKPVLGRQPLIDVSAGRGNMSPVRVGRDGKDPFQRKEPAVTDREDDHMDQCEEMKDLPFDESEMLSGTPATPMSVLPRKLRSTFDETTAEF
ncbi:hypothetical protein H2199_005463 [Coniosporium tulheliwenetii]|uniref:Uncharacterized protein n=1 Tax=Coniosporium tulheliwenetii TaxID=3383036 RepID=A0ACC2Z1A1_9PEZI|nr:hypothetical protein H2199_005463 [Cladosporium sp. JES 115]